MPHFDRVRARWLPPLLVIVAVVASLPFVGRPLPAWLDGESGELALDYAIDGVILLWVLWQCTRARVRLRDLLGPAPRRSTDWVSLLLVPALIAMAIGSIFLFWLPISFVAPDLVQSYVLDEEPPVWNAVAPVRSVFAVSSGVIVAPVLEELLFRGVLLHRWAYRWGVRTAVLVSALAFGILHADVLGAGVFGVVMALLYMRTGTLWIPIACHVLNNAVAALGETFDVGGGTSATVASFQREWYIGAIALAAAIVALYLMRGLYLPPAGWRLPVLAGHRSTPAAPLTSTGELPAADHG